MFRDVTLVSIPEEGQYSVEVEISWVSKIRPSQNHGRRKSRQRTGSRTPNLRNLLDGVDTQDPGRVVVSEGISMV